LRSTPDLAMCVLFYRYADVVDPLDTTQAYAWNPCYPFTLNACNNVAVSIG